ncbi:MAG: DUF6241 domain-containing protein [Clostridiaceae bacterium]
MEKYEKVTFKFKAIGVIIILCCVVFAVLFVKIKDYRNDTKTPEVKESLAQIVSDNQDEFDCVQVDVSKITNKNEIYNLIHKMANTLIVAEDNQIYGETPINSGSVNKAMIIVCETDLISEDEKEVLLNILQAWKNGDYSNGVQAHNYVWKRLDGNIGRAKELRSEYKN